MFSLAGFRSEDFLAVIAGCRSKKFKGGLHAIPGSDNSGTAPLAPSPELLRRGVNSVARKGFEKARQVWRGCGCADGDANLAIASLSGNPPEGDAKRTDALKSPTHFSNGIHHAFQQAPHKHVRLTSRVSHFGTQKTIL